MLLPLALSIGLNGKCGPNIGACDAPLCCSQLSFCGAGVEHCELGCQPLYGTCSGEVHEHPNGMPVRTDNRCGPEVVSRCPTAKPCCNRKGQCGASAEDCGNGCQLGY